MFLQVRVHTSIVPRDELEYHVVATAQFFQKPVLGLGSQGRRAFKKHAPQQDESVRSKDALFVAIAVKLRDTFKQRPQKEQSFRRGVGVLAKHGQYRRDVEMRKINLVRDSVEERGGAIFEERGHFGVDGAENDKTSRHPIRLR